MYPGGGENIQKNYPFIEAQGANVPLTAPDSQDRKGTIPKPNN
jgi:hypothetical protein